MSTCFTRKGGPGQTFSRFGHNLAKNGPIFKNSTVLDVSRHLWSSLGSFEKREKACISIPHLGWKKSNFFGTEYFLNIFLRSQGAMDSKTATISTIGIGPWYQGKSSYHLRHISQRTSDACLIQRYVLGVRGNRLPCKKKCLAPLSDIQVFPDISEDTTDFDNVCISELHGP